MYTETDVTFKYNINNVHNQIHQKQFGLLYKLKQTQGEGQKVLTSICNYVRLTSEGTSGELQFKYRGFYFKWVKSKTFQEQFIKCAGW